MEKLEEKIWATDLLQFIDNKSLKEWLGWNKDVANIKIEGIAIVKSD